MIQVTSQFLVRVSRQRTVIASDTASEALRRQAETTETRRATGHFVGRSSKDGFVSVVSCAREQFA
jgi:hypothetical protein